MQAIDIRVDRKEAEAILRRVNRKDPASKDMESFRALIVEKPRTYTDLGATFLDARQVYLNTLNGIERECIKLRLEEIEKELSAPGDGAMEGLLIDHVVLCWLRLMMVERQYTVAMDQSISLTLGLFWEKRLGAAQKRFIRATENLARVRKLMRRAITVVAVNSGRTAEPPNQRRR
jgi:hypothetical protein